MAKLIAAHRFFVIFERRKFFYEVIFMKLIAKLTLLCILACLLALCLPLHVSAETTQTEPTVLLESEPNGTEQTATPINVNIPVLGNLSSSSDKDYYTFSLSNAGAITLSFSAESKKASPEAWMIMIEDSYNNPLSPEKKVTDTSEYISASYELAEGKYYVMIKAANTAQYGSGQYTLTVNSVEPVHVCQLEDVAYKASTCTENGNNAYRICNGCNTMYDQNGNVLEYDDVIIPSQGHQWSEFSVSLEPTCETAGEEIRSCAVCRIEDRKTINHLGHEICEEWVTDSMPSCLTAGCRSRHCTRMGCSHRENVTVIPATGHQIEDAVRIEVKNATCTEAGERKIYCTVNGCDGFVLQEISALQHDVSAEWTIDQAASCVSAGSRSHHCTRTGCDHRADVTVIPATGHQIEDAVRIEVKNATCTEAGEKKIYCTVIGCNGYVLEKLAELKHKVSLEWMVDKEATCVSSGSKSHHCLRDGCDYRRNVTEIPAKGHDHDEEFTVDLEPTCKDQGIQSRHCKRCSDRVDVTPIAKVAHDMIELVSKSATCIQSGILSKQCSVCKHQTDEVIPPTNQHIYGAWQESKASTCSAEGERKRTCVGCELSKVEAIPKLSHPYSQEWTVDALPSCTVAGSESRRCTVCDHVAEQRQIAALGHDFSDKCTVDVFPTCESVGSQSRHCSRCEEKGERVDIPATGHAYSAWLTTSAPTCVQKGKESRTCGVCGKSQVKDTDSALGHDFGTEFLIDVAATCGGTGSRSKHCSRCSAVSETTEIPALGHSFGAWSVTVAPTCEECGKMSRSCQTCGGMETKNTESALGHHYADSFTVDVEATCEGEGSRSRHCRRCNGKTEVTVIPAAGHSFGEWEEILLATCVENGKEARVCLVCEKVEQREGTLAMGHDYGEVFTVDELATCQKTGTRSKHCSRCNSRTDVSEIPMLEHSYDEGEIIAEPTAEVTGTKRFTCSACGSTYEKEMEKLPPVMLESTTESWNPAREEPMAFRSAAALADFIEVRVNGEIVPRDCYVLREGSTIVELTPEYLRTLKGGTYTLEIVSTTGIASAEFSVSKSPDKIWIWLTAAAVLLIGGMVCAILIRRRNRNLLARESVPSEPQASESDEATVSELSESP